MIVRRRRDNEITRDVATSTNRRPKYSQRGLNACVLTKVFVQQRLFPRYSPASIILPICRLHSFFLSFQVIIRFLEMRCRCCLTSSVTWLSDFIEMDLALDSRFKFLPSVCLFCGLKQMEVYPVCCCWWVCSKLKYRHTVCVYLMILYHASGKPVLHVA